MECVNQYILSHKKWLDYKEIFSISKSYTER